MDLMSEFRSICEELAQFRTTAARARDLADDEGMSHQMSHLLDRLDEELAELQTTVPQAVEEIEQRNATTLSEIQEVQQTLEEVKGKAEEQEQLETAEEELEVQADPQLAALLHNELLEQFEVPAPRGPETPAPTDQSSPTDHIWEGWDDWDGVA